jgi:hypothetical protein
MGDVVLMQECQRAQDLCNDTVCLGGWEWVVARQESAQVATGTVGHDQTELAAFILEEVEDREDIWVVRVCIIERGRRCNCACCVIVVGRGIRAHDRVAIYLDGEQLSGLGVCGGFAFV